MDERGTVGRAQLDGQSPDGHFVVGARAPAGVAVRSGYVYWSNYPSGTIGRAKLDGSGVNQRFIKTGAYYSVAGIAVDGRYIYWAGSGIDPNTGAIGRANLDGSHVDKHFIKAGNAPVGLAVDEHHIYWTHNDFREGKSGVAFAYAIGRANLDGSGVDLHFIRVSNVLDGLAVSSRYIFWSNYGEHVIGRANVDGTGAVQRCFALTALPLENISEGIATDGRYVYWTNYPADTISRGSVGGSKVENRLVPVAGVPEGVAVQVTGGGAQSSGHERCVGSPAPLLLGPPMQTAGPYGEGWGEVAPAVISNGGAAASGTVSSIHWTSWGGPVATGRGLHPEYAPKGGYYPKPLVMEVRASDVRRCTPGGRPVYTRFTVREQVKPGGRMAKKWFAWAANMCAGFR